MTMLRKVVCVKGLKLIFKEKVKQWDNQWEKRPGGTSFKTVKFSCSHAPYQKQVRVTKCHKKKSVKIAIYALLGLLYHYIKKTGIDFKQQYICFWNRINITENITKNQ